MGNKNPGIPYYINDIIIPVQSDCRDLGITVCDNLKFSKYIREQVTKAFKIANIIFRCFYLYKEF